jgi:hypothetical protein
MELVPCGLMFLSKSMLESRGEQQLPTRSKTALTVTKFHVAGGFTRTSGLASKKDRV